MNKYETYTPNEHEQQLMDINRDGFVEYFPKGIKDALGKSIEELKWQARGNLATVVIHRTKLGNPA